LHKDIGRCVSCGFLAHHALRGGWYEVEPSERASGDLLQAAIPGADLTSRPGCVVFAADLESEYEGAVKAAEAAVGPNDPYRNGIETGIRRMLNADRQCPKWFPYQRGLSPKDHVERLHVIQLEKDRAELQVRLAEMEQESRRASEQIQADSLEIAKLTKATMDGLRDIASKTDAFTTTWTKWAIRIAVAALFVVLAQYLFPDLGRHVGEWIDRTLGYPLGRG
jgi:hypothetical protein